MLNIQAIIKIQTIQIQTFEVMCSILWNTLRMMLSIFQNEWNIIDWNLNICCKMERDHKDQTPMSTKSDLNHNELTTMLLFLRDDHSDGISACYMNHPVESSGHFQYWHILIFGQYIFQNYWFWRFSLFWQDSIISPPARKSSL